MCVLLWLCYSETFVRIDTVLIISITSYHQFSGFRLSYLILSVDSVLLGWTWLQNEEKPDSNLIYAWGYWWASNELTQYTLFYRSCFLFWSSVACWAVILAGCGGCLGGLFVQCSLTSKLHVLFMPDKTSEISGISPQLTFYLLSYALPYLPCAFTDYNWSHGNV